MAMVVKTVHAAAKDAIKMDSRKVKYDLNKSDEAAKYVAAGKNKETSGAASFFFLETGYMKFYESCNLQIFEIITNPTPHWINCGRHESLDPKPETPHHTLDHKFLLV
ncbi:unnamed protein product [Prunus armeniaca]